MSATAGAGRGPSSSAEGWGVAARKAVLVLVLSFLGFLVVPDRLASYLSVHIVPNARDALVVAWWVAFFVFLSWVFVRLQRGATP